MKLAFIILAALAAIGLIALIFKLISGAVMVITGAFNAVLGLAVVAALIIIVVWMFSYAKKNR
jgi:hypothetical protein